MRTIEVMRPGSKVRIGPDRAIPGEVVAVTVRGESLEWTYEISWWDGRDLKVGGFEAWQVTPEATVVARIGFA